MAHASKRSPQVVSPETTGVTVKTIYHLREDRERIANSQAASLSPKPFGLKPVDGLFASDQWWHNLDKGVIPIIRYAGTITRVFRSEIENGPQCFEILSDGNPFQYNCVASSRRDRKLYKVGAYVELAFVRQELKRPVVIKAGEAYDTHVLCLVEVRITESPIAPQ